MEYEDVSDLISEQDYLKYFDLIANELSIREEVLDLDTSNHCLDAIYGLDYCPNYVWADGDEEIFGCDQDTWERTFHAVPVSQPLSMARLAEIGTQAISYVLENSDIAIEDLTESIGMSMAELKQLGIYDPGPDGPTDPIKFEVFDAQNRKTHTCDDIHAALDIYKSLGDSPFKSVDAVIPPGYTYSGRLLLMHQQAGKDVLMNIDTEQPQILALHEHFSGTVVEDAFKAVNARLCSVVAHAIENENHFAFLPGTYLKNEPGERLEVHGKPVQEQYADARFYVEVADMVVLNGIRTNREAFEKNGKTGHYTQVKMPTINSYEVDGEKRYQKAFEGRIRTGTLEDGTNYSIDYGDLLQGLILAERKVVLNLDRKTSLDDKMKAAEASKAEPAANAAPVQEAERV